MNEELNLDVCVVVVFYSNFNFLKATVRVESHPKSKSGDKIKISKPCPCSPLALLIVGEGCVIIFVCDRSTGS